MLPSIFSAREREETAIPIDAVLRDGRIDIFPDVQRRDFFDVRFTGDRLSITAGKFVGLIPLNERVTIQVVPKMPIANLLAMLSIANGDIVELDILQREYRTARLVPAPVASAIATAFLRALQAVEAAGLRKGYRRVVEAASILKGQLQIDHSLRSLWSRGITYSAVSAYSTLTSDVPENRLLRCACHALIRAHRKLGVLAGSAPTLARFDSLFAGAGVQLERRGSLRGDVNGIAERQPVYRCALRLAHIILADYGVDLSRAGDDVSLSSFLLDLETTFERYVRNVLARRLDGYEVMDGMKEGSKPLYDDRPEPRASPDVVIRGPDGGVLIAEVKYKSSEKRDDIDQVLAYALSYRAPVVLLVLPAQSSGDRGVSHVGIVDGVRVLRFRFDLSADDLNSSEADLVACVASLLVPQ